MALEDLSLESLQKTKLNAMFKTALNEVAFSFNNAADIPGNRSISIDLVFKQMDGYIITEMACTHKVPGRKVHAIASLEDSGNIKIDTVSNDARQPDLLEHSGANVRTIDTTRKREVSA